MKNIEKLLSQILKVYGILLIIVFILKLLGANYFEMAIDNPTIVKINEFIKYWRLENLWYAITLYIYEFIIIGIMCNDNSKKLKKYCLLTFPIVILVQYLKTSSTIFVFVDFVYLFLLGVIYLKITKRKLTKTAFHNYLLFVIFNILFQVISIITRNNALDICNRNFIVNFIYNFDYLLMTIIFYKYYFMKRSESLWQMVVFSFLHLLDLLKTLPTKLHKYYQNNKLLTKTEKISNSLFIPIYIAFNILTLVIILIIARLNNALMEAMFITLAYWLSKNAFGKPYHCKSVITCFLVSSLTYYCLTRLTLETGITFLIPILLGVLLSYITAKLVKNNYDNKLYKGMPEADFMELITKVTDNKLDIKMCKEFYCDRLTEREVAKENNYCVSSFEKRKKKIVDDIKNYKNK